MKSFLLPILFLFAALTGCAQVKTSVSSFHEINQDLTGQTFVLVPSTAQDGQLEHKTYALLVKQQLERIGLKEVQFSEARYAVTMAYGIDNGQAVTQSYPIFGKTGTSGSYTTGSVTGHGNNVYVNATTTEIPTYGVVGRGTTSGTEYKRFLDIDIIDISKSSAEKLVKLYEGKAKSIGSTSQLSAVMPAMVKSVFKNFPGRSGAVQTVFEPLDQ